MCLLDLDPASARRTSARLLCLFIACLGLSVAIPSVADHLHLIAHGVKILDFIRGFLIGLSITLLALLAIISRRCRSKSAPAAR